MSVDARIGETESGLDGASPQTYVSRVLARLESEFRALALLALADWEQLEIAEPELFAALGALLRPSWGSWNFLLQSLRNARKAQLRTGRSDVRDQLEKRRTLQTILTLLDTNASEDTLAAALPIAKLLGDKARLKRIGDVLVLPIALRNQVAHFPPTEDHEWEPIRAALVPLAAWHQGGPVAMLLKEQPMWPAPWFYEQSGVVWAYNGIERDHTPSFAAVGSRPLPLQDLAAAVMLSLQRLLGRTHEQDAGFHRLLARLAPEEIRGVILGDFLVGPRVGRGGFAAVHVARQLSTGRKVAIKLLHDGMGDDARLRFQQEAAFLARINHTSVVGVINHGEDAWSVPRFVDLRDETWFAELAKGAAIKSYIALEWIEGRTLEELFRAAYVEKTESPPSNETLRAWFLEAARALAAVHATGLIHRDIKPGNLMVDHDGRIRLMDFGIARSEDENRTLMTNTGYALGTPPYMAPEQLRARDADAEVGPQADIYALGACFYELATGGRLFDHEDDPPETVRTRKLRGERPRLPRRVERALPWELNTILMGTLEPEVSDRYVTAIALQADLTRWERDEPLAYRRPSVPRRLRLAYRRNRAVAHTGAAAAAVVIVGIFFYVASTTAARDRAERALAETTLRLAIEQAGGGELPAATRLVTGLPPSEERDLLLAFWGNRLESADSARKSLAPPFHTDVRGDAVVVLREGHGFRIPASSIQKAALTRDGANTVIVVNAQRSTIVALVDNQTFNVHASVVLDEFDAHGLFQRDGQQIAVLAGIVTVRSGIEKHAGVVFDLESGAARVISHFALSDDCRYAGHDNSQHEKREVVITAAADLMAVQPLVVARAEADHVRFDGADLDLHALRHRPRPGDTALDIADEDARVAAGYKHSKCRVPELAHATVKYPAELPALWETLTFAGNVPRAWFREDAEWARAEALTRRLDVAPINMDEAELDDRDATRGTPPPIHFDGGRSVVEFVLEYSGVYRFSRFDAQGKLETTKDVMLGFESELKISGDQSAAYVTRAKYQDASFSIVLPARNMELSPSRGPAEPPPGRLASFTVDSSQVSVLDNDGRLWRWHILPTGLTEAAPPRFVAEPDGPHGVLAVAALSDGGLLVAWNDARLTRVNNEGQTLWSVRTGAGRTQAKVEEDERIHASLELSDDERFVVAIHGPIVELFSTTSGASLTGTLDIVALCEIAWTEHGPGRPKTLTRDSFCASRSKHVHARVASSGELRVSAGEYTYVRAAPPPLSLAEARARSADVDLFAFARAVDLATRTSARGLPTRALRSPLMETSRLPTAEPVIDTMQRSKPNDRAVGRSWTVQAAASNDKEDADALVRQLLEKGVSATVIRTVSSGGVEYYRVRVGVFSKLEEAEREQQRCEVALGHRCAVMRQ